MQEIRKALMGHSSGQDVNAIYTHVELPAKRDAIRKLEAWLASQTPTQPEPAGVSNVLTMKKEVISSRNITERREAPDVQPLKARDPL